MIWLLSSHIDYVYHAILLFFMNLMVDTLSLVLKDKGNFNHKCTKDSWYLTSWTRYSRKSKVSYCK
jgi:hypothetical protein